MSADWIPSWISKISQRLKTALQDNKVDLSGKPFNSIFIWYKYELLSYMRMK